MRNTIIALTALFSASALAETPEADEDFCLLAGLELASSYEQLKAVDSTVEELKEEYLVLAGRYQETENLIEEAISLGNDSALTDHLETSSELFNRISEIKREAEELDVDRKVLTIDVYNASERITENSCEEYLGLE